MQVDFNGIDNLAGEEFRQVFKLLNNRFHGTLKTGTGKSWYGIQGEIREQDLLPLLTDLTPFCDWDAVAYQSDNGIAHIYSIKAKTHIAPRKTKPKPKAKKVVKEEKITLPKLPKYVKKIEESKDVAGTYYIYTKALPIRYLNVWYHIEPAKIEVSQRALKFIGIKTGRGLRHPHIDYGDACLGNSQYIVWELIRQNKIEALAGVLVRFLQSYNPSGPYERITNGRYKRWRTA